MRKILICFFVLAVATAGMVGSAGAAPPEKSEIRFGIDFPDFENGFVVFINTTRDAVCTAEQLHAELAIIDWFPEYGEAFFSYLDANGGDPSGFEGEFPPEEPPRPEGIALLSNKEKLTRKGALMVTGSGRNLHIEIWRQVDAPPGVGPCTDTLGMTEPYAVGTANVGSRDNDAFGSDTRGNSFGNRVNAKLKASDGESIIYRSQFHLNSRCNEPKDGPPSCLVQSVRVG